MAPSDAYDLRELHVDCGRDRLSTNPCLHLAECIQLTQISFVQLVASRYPCENFLCLCVIFFWQLTSPACKVVSNWSSKAIDKRNTPMIWGVAQHRRIIS